MANPSIDKTRVRNLPTNGVFTVNNIAPDGLGNVTITAGDVGAIGNVNDTNSIDLTKFGTDISADLVVDVNTDNLISVSPTGTFADKKAVAHSYDNATSGLTATTVQGAIDEVEARVDTAETSITTLQTDVGTLQGDVTALQTGKLETVSDTNSIDLTKTGVNVSAALKLDVSANNLLSVSGAGTFADKRAIAHTYDPTASGLTATNVQAAIDEVEARVDTLETTKVGTVSDTNSIDLTKTGVNVSADVKIDPDTNNLTSITASGVFSDERAAAHTYSNVTSGLAATQVQAAIDEIAAVSIANPQFIVGENISIGNAMQVEGQSFNSRTSQSIGNISISQPFYGDGVVRNNSISLNLYHNNNFTVTYTVRIETDSGGVPSGTLVNANATSTLTVPPIPAISSFQWDKFSFAGIFAISGLNHVVVTMTYPSGDPAQAQVGIGTPTYGSTTVLPIRINGVNNNTARMCMMSNFCSKPLLVRSLLDTIVAVPPLPGFKRGFVGFASQTYSVGQSVSLPKVLPSYSGFSGLTVGGAVYIDPSVAGGITQTAPAVNRQTIIVGYADTSSTIITSEAFANRLFLGEYNSGPMVQLNSKATFHYYSGVMFHANGGSALPATILYVISGADYLSSSVGAAERADSTAGDWYRGQTGTLHVNYPSTGLIGNGYNYNIFYGE